MAVSAHFDRESGHCVAGRGANFFAIEFSLLIPGDATGLRTVVRNTHYPGSCSTPHNIAYAVEARVGSFDELLAA